MCIRDRCLLFTKCQRFSWYHRYFIDVVFVVDDDTYYWVYLSSDHLFQVYYKVRQVLLQSATAFFYYKVRSSVITKCDSLVFLLQSATSVIKNCDRYYKKWQFYYKVRHVLQSAKIITKCHRTWSVDTYTDTWVDTRSRYRPRCLWLPRVRQKIRVIYTYATVVEAFIFAPYFTLLTSCP